MVVNVPNEMTGDITCREGDVLQPITSFERIVDPERCQWEGVGRHIARVRAIAPHPPHAQVVLKSMTRTVQFIPMRG